MGLLTLFSRMRTLTTGSTRSHLVRSNWMTYGAGRRVGIRSMRYFSILGLMGRTTCVRTCSARLLAKQNDLECWMNKVMA